ncbi:Asp-tRNA(Asn)/Glu-tRNA(Gln) amidotransferase subunit GatC [Kosmotoga pacifica]|uniref:Aspartyl/glutamyl-tRNA(Asn/Gln) amidotransferase subunit C n=1 Tax=Kosmotoga pacifica TaxID=1330330 RepID=A0A0G2Z8C8_9BACT|nr:Asp-tRNA(Asn)/Glu-tRNA(Gln) amidotransferase subunit GatC [Kosmotoga pacifica]AKI97870.1 glutamyl amidotransferase [Kosmotoga pacifica]
MNIHVDEKLLIHLESLAKLELKPKERQKLMKDIAKILDYMSLIDEVDVSEYEEMFTPVEDNLDLRTDEQMTFEHTDDLVALFPDREDKQLKVPKIY